MTDWGLLWIALGLWCFGSCIEDGLTAIADALKQQEGDEE